MGARGSLIPNFGVRRFRIKKPQSSFEGGVLGGVGEWWGEDNL